MALDLLRSAKSILKIDDLTIDNIVFKLHYRVTVAILIGSSLVGVAKQYFGDPINCQTSSGVSSAVLDDYCWIHSTFHIRSEFQGSVGCVVDPELIIERQGRYGEPGYFINYSNTLSSSTPDTSFYQWVPFILIFQAALFYIPRKIWKTCEGGLMASFGKDARQIVILKGDFENQRDKGSLVKEDIARKYITYFQSILHHNNGYFGLFLICEILNLVVDLVNIYLTDFFLAGRFMKYGSQVVKYLSHNQHDRLQMPNPMCTVFPTVTSCTFHTVGTAAGEQKFNSVCILSLNIINEKVYLLLWFWLFGLTILTSSHLLFRLLTIMVPPLRRLLILVKIRGFTSSDLSSCKNVLSHCYLGDWFVLYQLSKNSNTYFFRYLLRLMDSSFAAQTKSKYFTLSRGSLSKFSEEGRKRKQFPSNGQGAEEDQTVQSAPVQC